MFTIVAHGLDRWLAAIVILVVVGPAARQIEEGTARGPGNEQGKAEDELG